jgi:hypothetical protein
MSVRRSGVSFYVQTPATAIAAGAVAAGALTVVGQLKLGNGSAAAPALAFTTDPTQGIYRESASSVATAIAGVKCASVGSSGFGSGKGMQLDGFLAVITEAVKTANYGCGASDAIVAMNGTPLVLTMPFIGACVAGHLIWILNLHASATLRINRYTASGADQVQGVAADHTLPAAAGALFCNFGTTWRLLLGGPLTQI